jgi:DNA-binding response OmpR family regulator
MIPSPVIAMSWTAASKAIAKGSRLVLMPRLKTVWLDGNQVSLSPLKFEILATLMLAYPRLLRTREIADYVYGGREDGGPLSVGSVVHTMLKEINAVLPPINLRVRKERHRGVTLAPLAMVAQVAA